MNGIKIFIITMVATTAAFAQFSCTKNNKKLDATQAEEVPLSEVDIEKKYLSEGFISPDLYRTVIVMTKVSSTAAPDAVLHKAKKRAQVSLERCMNTTGTPADRNIRAEILTLIEQNGDLSKKDISHQRYDVFYFDIVKNNLKNHLKNMATAR
ncbi:MAG: hypothetical protein JXA07_06085 [Spirochaetes bacterium]|nr:hypothetical protein [Spirochaetota bacterium]